VSSKPQTSSLIRGMLIGSVCGMILGALATTLAGQAVLSLVEKAWKKLARREKGVDFRWLLQ